MKALFVLFAMLAFSMSQSITDVVFGNLHTSTFDSLVLKEDLQKIKEHVRKFVKGAMRGKEKHNAFSVDAHKTEECTAIQLSEENLIALGESAKETLSQIYESLYIIAECEAILDKIEARAFEHAEFPVVQYTASSAVTQRLLQALHIYEKKLGKDILTIDYMVGAMAIGRSTEHSDTDRMTDPSKCDTNKAWFLQPHLHLRAPININTLRLHFRMMKTQLGSTKGGVERVTYSIAKLGALTKYYEATAEAAPKLHWDHETEPKHYTGADIDRSLVNLMGTIVDGDKELRRQLETLEARNAKLQFTAFATNGDIDYSIHWAAVPLKTSLRNKK